MDELLIQKTPVKPNLNDSDSFSGQSEKIKFDPVKETLKRLRPHSKLKKILCFILYKFYSCQILIAFISFILGFLTFGLPLLFIYNSIIKNIITPFLIICIFALIFSIVLIIIHIIDGNKHKSSLIAKWERKNILKNIGISFTLIILIISVSLTINFYSKAIIYQNDEAIILDNEEASLSEELKCDFFFKYILNMIYFFPSDINENNKNHVIKYYFSEDEYINILRRKIMNSSIPLLLVSFNKIIKCFIIQVKYPVEQFLFFFGAFSFLLLNVIINNYEHKKLIELDIEVISVFQIIMLGIIYIGYISWLLHSSFRFIKNPKDKNFAIRKYNFFCIFVLLLFDLITFLGSSLFFLSILYFYVSISFGEEIFQKLNISLFILKNGFLLILIGNSYYFGHYLLSMIFRPLSIQYAPYELKNKSYVKANRKLINILNTKKSAFKLKDVAKK
jgi:hypothetical protein